MTSHAQSYGIDPEYLRRGKSSTPEQKLSWLAAAVEFVRMTEKKKGKGAKKR